MSRETEAIEFKNKGNKAFSAGDFPAAVNFYSKAIELNDKEPTFFTNRAQVRAHHPLFCPHVRSQ